MFPSEKTRCPRHSGTSEVYAHVTRGVGRAVFSAIWSLVRIENKIKHVAKTIPTDVIYNPWLSGTSEVITHVSRCVGRTEVLKSLIFTESTFLGHLVTRSHRGQEQNMFQR